MCLFVRKWTCEDLIEDIDQFFVTASDSKNCIQQELNCIEIPFDCSNKSLNSIDSSLFLNNKSSLTNNNNSNYFLPTIEQVKLGLDQCPIEITNALQANRWFVIFGDPGSAKTTLLRWITHIFAEAAYHEDEEIVFEEESVYLPIRIPIRIRIVEFAEWLIQHQTKTLIDYIGEHTWFSERYCHAEDGNVLKELIYHDYALILLVELMGGASSFF